MRRAAWMLALILTLVACTGEGSDPEPLGTMPPPETSVSPGQTGSSDATSTLPACADVPAIAATADAYADTPIYVANEMPVEEVQEWASRRPGFEAIWVDRDHNGWITVAFSRAASERQAELTRAFPGVGVVAVPVEWRMSDLEALQSRVTTELAEVLDSFSVGVSVTRGVVDINVGVLDERVRTEIESRFGDQPVCVSGQAPAGVPAPGPQPLAGDGWRLLADEPRVGTPYRTGIATDRASLEALWTQVGLDGRLPDVNFESEIVIWFGAVFSGSCPDIRLDDVVVNGDVVHASIVLPNPPVACTSDANPRAYIVAIERTLLPPGPFMVQLDADGPPAGAPEERTIVAADLSIPGAVASSAQIGPDPNLPEEFVVESGDFIEPDFSIPYRLWVHCGIEWLGELNGFQWRTTEPMPNDWRAVVTPSETIELTLRLTIGAEPVIEATAANASVTYRPSQEAAPICE